MPVYYPKNRNAVGRPLMAHLHVLRPIGSYCVTQLRIDITLSKHPRFTCYSPWVARSRSCHQASLQRRGVRSPTWKDQPESPGGRGELGSTSVAAHSAHSESKMNGYGSRQNTAAANRHGSDLSPDRPSGPCLLGNPNKISDTHSSFYFVLSIASPRTPAS
jgi:hypothetical protein